MIRETAGYREALRTGEAGGYELERWEGEVSVEQLGFRMKGGDVWVEWLWVEESRRSQGRATGLYQWLKEWAAVNGAAWVVGRVEHPHALAARNRVFGSPAEMVPQGDGCWLVAHELPGGGA